MKYLLILIALVVVLDAPAQAQTFPTITCDDCRGPAWPRDYRNTAFNAVFGPDRILTLDEADFFFIQNPAGVTVGVDINMDIKFLEIDLILPITLPWPVGYEIEIILNMPGGDQVAYNMDPRAYPRGLPVGGGGPGGGNGGGGGPGGGSGGGGGGPPPDDPPSGGSRCGTTAVDGGPRRRTCR